MQPGLIYHLTHRCHNGEFLFRFARDRAEYCRRLRALIKRCKVSLLNYCVTSNHSHLIATETLEGSISMMMQRLEGDFAAYYNRRKERTGAFWTDRFHCTMVEDGAHLMNCMVYVDLNMVRAGVVSHPSEWHWCGHEELIGNKNQYRLLNLERVLQSFGYPDPDRFRMDFENRITEAIQRRQLAREAHWTESIAVGSESYVRKIASAIGVERRDVVAGQGADGSWSLQESMAEYRFRRCRFGK